MHKRHQSVVSYTDDVYVWVYLDQIDRVIRYEAYVVDYDDCGCPSTLKFVIEEGVLDNAHEVPLLNQLLQKYCHESPLARAALLTGHQLAPEGQVVAAPPLRYFYNFLTEEQLAEVHSYFAAQEAALKRDKKSRWIRSLRALGFDVVSSLA
jgi:hypothetical protein